MGIVQICSDVGPIGDRLIDILLFFKNRFYLKLEL